MSTKVNDEEIKKDDISKNYLNLIKEVTHKSNYLPNHGEDFEFLSSFEEFQGISSQLGSKILNTMQAIIKRNKLRGNFVADNSLMSLDEKFDILVDVNDQFFERIATKIDAAMGYKKDASLVAVSKTPKIKTNSSNLNATPKSFAYSLLTARNISRPQQYFQEKIDNSLNLFYPKLKSKPNAIVPFEESIKTSFKENQKNSENLLSYEHPYKVELENHKADISFIQVVDPLPPKELDETPLTLISNESQLNDLCNKLVTAKEFAVDLEAHSFRSYQGFTCLMQISTVDEDFIVDALALRHLMYKLNDCFTNPNILKVFHGADMDIVWLQRDFGIYVVNMFDTHQASRALSLKHNSLAYLMKHYCNKDVDKKYQLADWRIRPLPNELITYAREDTHFLLYIYNCVKIDLVQRSNGTTDLLQVVFDKSNSICKKTYEKPQFHETSFREMFFMYQSKSNLKTIMNGQQMEALKNLYSWRDRIARLEDESTGYVLPNHMLFQIAETLPKEPEGILACCKPIPPLVKRELFDIHQIILKARDPSFFSQNTVKNDIIGSSKIQQPKILISTKLPHDFSHPIDDINNMNGEGDNLNNLNLNIVYFDESILKKEPIINFTNHNKIEKSNYNIANLQYTFFEFFPLNIRQQIFIPDEIICLKENLKWKFSPSTKLSSALNNNTSASIPNIQNANKKENDTIESSTNEVIQSIREHMNMKIQTVTIDNEIKMKNKKHKEVVLAAEPFMYKKIDLDSQIVEEKFNRRNKKSLKRNEETNPHSIEESDYKPSKKKKVPTATLR